jgi:hypothetical protein
VVGLGESVVYVGTADRLTGGAAVGASLLLTAAAAGLLARPLEQPLARDLSALLVAASGAAVWWATAAPPSVVVAVAIAVSLATTAGALWVGNARPDWPWIRPLTELALLSTLASLVAAALDLPDRGLLVLALAVAGTTSIAVGLALHRLVPQLAGPLLLLAAWYLLTAEALRGEVVWMTAPVGVTMLAMVGLVRRNVASLGGHGTPDTVIPLEWVGMGLLIAPSAVEVLAGRIAFAILLLTVGVVLAGWGVTTQVRRRLYAGALSVVLAVVLVVGVPLAELAASADYGPTSGSAVFWLLVAGIGVVAIIVAVFLEQGRAKVREVRQRLHDLTDGWE